MLNLHKWDNDFLRELLSNQNNLCCINFLLSL